jgi:hypothetical protein
MVNRRDEQIAAINSRSEGLRQDRLEECKTQIREAYQSSSVVEQLANLVEIEDREPSDFRVLTSSEARYVDHFNDDSFYWDMYCKELARSIATSERLHIFERLEEIPGEGQSIDASNPNFRHLLDGIDQLRDKGYNPTIVIVPISLHGAVFRRLNIDIHTGRDIVLADGSRLHVFWSSRVVPIDRIVVLDAKSGNWNVKLDPETKSRLTVAIGRPSSPPNAVTFLAETVVKYEIVDPGRLFTIEVEGIPSTDLYAEGNIEKEEVS